MFLVAHIEAHIEETTQGYNKTVRMKKERSDVYRMRRWTTLFTELTFFTSFTIQASFSIHYSSRGRTSEILYTVVLSKTKTGILKTICHLTGNKHTHIHKIIQNGIHIQQTYKTRFKKNATTSQLEEHVRCREKLNTQWY